jgi:tetratricopeptide (TPR) repeat protein
VTRILDLAQSLADRFYDEGVAYEEMGAVDEAMHSFQRAVQADGAHVPARLALAYHCRRLDRVDEAIEHCEAAVASEPTAAAFFTLGYMLGARGEYNRALRALRRCLDIDPSYQQARYQIAFVYYLKAEYNVAITEFHRVAQHEADWETLFFLGECYRTTHRPQEADRVFRRALPLATNWGQVEITRAQLAACKRLAEFPAGDPLSIKDRAYCDCGIVYLGTAMDDGISIPSYLFYNFDYTDLARTLHRFLALKKAMGWHWDAVVPVDIISLPLAMAMGQLLGVGTEPAPDGTTLVVQALGETVEGLQDTVEQLERAQSFCLLACWPEEWRPDIVGVVTPLVGSLPWYRTSAVQRFQSEVLGKQVEGKQKPVAVHDTRPPEAIAADIIAALADHPPDENQDALVAYYQTHAALRWR